MFAGHKKHPLKFAVIVLLVINLTAGSSATAWDECTVDLYYDLYQAVVDIRLITPCEPSDFTPNDAYAFQESFVERFELDSRGYQIMAGEFVITGAMNPLAFIERGHYKVDYGELGMIKFRVKGRKKAQN